MTSSGTIPTKLGHDPILHLSLGDIQPSPENDRLYHPVDPADPQIARLADSIIEHGIQEPLLVTRDRSPSAADVEDAGSENPAKERLLTQKNKGGEAGDSDTFSLRGVSN